MLKLQEYEMDKPKLYFRMPTGLHNYFSLPSHIQQIEAETSRTVKASEENGNEYYFLEVDLTPERSL